MGKLKVSVIMPAHNEERFLARAIESILNQTFKNFELIVINDASTDSTPKIVERYRRKDSRIRLLNNKKKLLIAGSLNKGIRLAKAEIIARMDADDVSLPHRLELQYQFLMNHPKVAVVGANMSIIDEDENEIATREYPQSSGKLKDLMFRYSPFAHPVVMYRKNIFLEVGGYADNIFPCDDIDLWFKIGAKYKFGSIPEPLLKYTLYRTSSSHKRLREVELTGLGVKLKAIKEYGYSPSPYDVLFNLAQYGTLWMPAGLRIKLYNFLRNRMLI